MQLGSSAPTSAKPTRSSVAPSPVATSLIARCTPPLFSTTRTHIFMSSMTETPLPQSDVAPPDAPQPGTNSASHCQSQLNFEKAFDRMIDDDDKFKKELEDVGGPPTFEDCEDSDLEDVAEEFQAFEELEFDFDEV
ncbi:hypothetical protein MRB53_021143 [Persea americana]|uniref:Uncharacterized protein n=1 Tax=Persea americana TaxID=3435 RepID=A0ACC2L2S3_PERAE|nr:hypothetical protein MRB53_021143 [Persea americana]